MMLFNGLWQRYKAAFPLHPVHAEQGDPAPATGFIGLRQPFDRKLLFRMSFALLGTVLLATAIVAPAYRSYTLARQNLFDLNGYRQILDTATAISAERGPANIVMAAEPQAVSAGQKRLADARATTDAALAQISAPPAPPFGLTARAIPAELLVRFGAQLAEARLKVDTVARGDFDDRSKLDAFQDAVDAMFAASNEFRTLIAWRAAELSPYDSNLAAPVLIGQMLSDLREYGGRLGSHLIAAMATGEKLPVRNVIDIRQSQGRLLELWHVVRGQGEPYNSTSLIEARAAIESRFFSDGLDLVEQAIADGRRDGQYSLTASQFTGRFVPTMRPIETYRRTFLDAAIARFEESREIALATLIVAVLTASTILAILIGLVLSIRTHIFQPLGQAYDNMLRLAEDRPAAASPVASEAGEIVNLFQAIEVLQDKMQERASLTSKLRLQADTDALTGLLNRRALDRALRRTKPDEVCLLLIDIDHFKQINDTLGHPVGDQVLIQIAAFLRTTLRSTDIVARFGGEEFAVVVTTRNLTEGLLVARKLRHALKRQTIHVGGTALHVTASFGVARGRTGEDDWQSVLEEADRALYSAKASGRDRVRCARTDHASLAA